MFEKEAELRSTKWFRENVDDSTYTTPFTERFCYELGFRSGAEFGYNKANEWHYVKDGDLPEQYESTCFSVVVLSNTMEKVRYRFDSGKWIYRNREVKVTAWHDLPKLEV